MGRSSGEGNDNPLQYSCLRNPKDRGAWWAWGRKRVRHNLATEQQNWCTETRHCWNQGKLHIDACINQWRIILSESNLKKRWGKATLAENKPLTSKVHSLHLRVEGHPYHQRQRVQGQESCISRSCYFFNLLPKLKLFTFFINQAPKPVSLSCQILTNLLFV